MSHSPLSILRTLESQYIAGPSIRLFLSGALIVDSSRVIMGRLIHEATHAL